MTMEIFMIARLLDNFPFSGKCLIKQSHPNRVGRQSQRSLGQLHLEFGEFSQHFFGCNYFLNFVGKWNKANNVFMDKCDRILQWTWSEEMPIGVFGWSIKIEALEKADISLAKPHRFLRHDHRKTTEIYAGHIERGTKKQTDFLADFWTEKLDLTEGRESITEIINQEK